MRGRPRCETRGCCRLFDPAVGFSRSAQRDLFERFDILNAVAHLVAQLEKHRAIRFGAPAFQSRLADSPALGQLSLRHASFVHYVRLSARVVRAAMKALFAAEGKLYVGEPRWFDNVTEVKDSEPLQTGNLR